MTKQGISAFYKHIPVIVLAVGFIGQIVSFTWYASKMDSRMTVLESAREADALTRTAAETKQDTQNQTMTAKIDDLSTRLARIEGILLGRPVANGATP